jgi:aryl-alcohol dehydrogenase-like predicted oxidoreductase
LALGRCASPVEESGANRPTGTWLGPCCGGPSSSGVNFIDTADAYGPNVSEELIAEALHPYPDDLVVATKGGLVRPDAERLYPDGRPEHLRQACEGSLRRLRLDQIPLYEFHRPDPAVPLEDSIGALVDLKDEGKTRHIGLSNVNEDQLRQAQALTPIVSIQNRYNTGDRSSKALVDSCVQEHMAFLPWAPVQNLDRLSTLTRVAEQHGATAYQVALAWLLARSETILPIPGTGSVQHLGENVAAAGLRLDRQEIASLSDIG